jgi:CheY-like chemotaxis protein
MYPNDRILVVEDDSDHFALIDEGFRRGRVANPIVRAVTAAEAINYLGGNGNFSNRELHPLPCLVLLDLSLPGESGFAVLEWVRQHPDLRKLPVVVLTGSRMNADLDKAYALGANSYVIKPFQFEDLQALIKSLNAFWILLAEKPRF